VSTVRIRSNRDDFCYECGSDEFEEAPKRAKSGYFHPIVSIDAGVWAHYLFLKGKLDEFEDALREQLVAESERHPRPTRVFTPMASVGAFVEESSGNPEAPAG
jgi:hypothetical protein